MKRRRKHGTLKPRKRRRYRAKSKLALKIELRPCRLKGGVFRATFPPELCSAPFKYHLRVKGPREPPKLLMHLEVRQFAYDMTLGDGVNGFDRLEEDIAKQLQWTFERTEMEGLHLYSLTFLINSHSRNSREFRLIMSVLEDGEPRLVYTSSPFKVRARKKAGMNDFFLPKLIGEDEELDDDIALPTASVTRRVPRLRSHKRKKKRRVIRRRPKREEKAEIVNCKKTVPVRTRQRKKPKRMTMMSTLKSGSEHDDSVGSSPAVGQRPKRSRKGKRGRRDRPTAADAAFVVGSTADSGNDSDYIDGEDDDLDVELSLDTDLRFGEDLSVSVPAEVGDSPGDVSPPRIVKYVTLDPIRVPLTEMDLDAAKVLASLTEFVLSFGQSNTTETPRGMPEESRGMKRGGKGSFGNVGDVRSLPGPIAVPIPVPVPVPVPVAVAVAVGASGV